MILLVLACAQGEWTVESAAAPHRARLDSDGDGLVSAAEYDRVAWSSRPFMAADGDGDGDLSTAELVALVELQSATGFDGTSTMASNQRTVGSGVVMGPRQRRLWELLAAMADELRAAGGTPPSPEAIAAAVQSEALDSAETAAVLATLRTEWTRLGWKWPLSGSP